MESYSPAEKLKRLRQKAGLSIEKMAERLSIPTSSYRHYEERYKDPYFPAHFVVSLALALQDMPDVANLAKQLALPTDALTPGLRGFAESAAALRGRSLAEELYPPAKQDEMFQIASDGVHLEIAARVNLSNIDKLIKRLQAARQLLD